MSATTPLVLFSDFTDLDPAPAKQLLHNHGITSELMRVDSSGQIDESQRHAIGIVVGFSDISAQMIDQLPQLGIIAATSNGTDMIDVTHATARGIWVTNVGHAATEEVAAHALMLTLVALREYPAMVQTVRNGGWTDDLAVVPRRISSLTLGLIGYGRIGAEFARIAAPLFGRVIAFDPFRAPTDGVAEPASLETVITESDVVSLHLPLTADTRDLIGADEITSMRDNAVLINVSRGELVDLDACIRALDSEKLASVGFDVLDGEPPAADHRLRNHPRAVVTPHAAFLSDEALRHYETDPASYITEWYSSGSPTACVVGRPATATPPL
ncbi:C-terminal binding protein [Salinibacterium sp. TMP30]|uniref:C-terminal binding protein n=1 Tax=Salinibacterium sp. TMP30 TaxID=3138237 RepID=UPI00313993A4